MARKSRRNIAVGVLTAIGAIATAIVAFLQG